jgi:riboflavin kinase
VAASGLGQATGFTDIPWVWSQLAERLHVHVWPGTFNARLVDATMQSAWDMLREQPGIPIEPADGACAARCFPVMVNERIRGAIVLPHIEGYPADQIEIVAAESIRADLGLRDGDPVTIRVLRTED